MKIRLSELFWIFFKISLVLIGGGYVLLPISIEEFSNKRKLLSKEEIIDFFALSQCLPGVIVVKTATFIGYHLRGKSGDVVSLLGLMLPPFVAILVVANFIKNASPILVELIDTVTIAVIVLIGASFFELAGVCLKNLFTYILFFITVSSFIFTDLPPVTIIILLTFFGVIAKYIYEFIPKGAKK